MTKKIVVINGSGGVGKDTFCDLCKSLTMDKTVSYSSVSLVKRIARECGWTGAKTERDRKFLSDLKELLTGYNDTPFLDVMKRVFEFQSDTENEVLFIHDRNISEIEKIVKVTGAVTLLVTNPNVEQIKSNIADAQVMDYEYDYNVVNSGTIDQLVPKARAFLQQIGVKTDKDRLF